MALRPTPDFLTGWEHGVVITGATPIPNDRIWHTVVTTGGTPGIDTTTPRSGARCLNIPATSAASSYVQRTVAATPTIGVASFYVRFVTSLPTADCQLFCFVTAAGSFGFVTFISSDSTIRASFGGGVNGASGIVVTTDTWYRVDVKLDCGVNPRLCDVQVNGAPCAQVSSGATASTISSFRIGKNVSNTTANGNIRYDDLVFSKGAPGDYPMGPHAVLAIRPNADGTHSFTAGDFGFDDAGADVGTGATDVWTRLDDATLDPPIGATDSIRQKVVRTTGYVEVQLEDAPLNQVAWGLQVLGSYDALGTTAPTTPQCQLVLSDPEISFTTVLYGGTDFSNTTVTFNTQCMTTRANGAPWTKAAIDQIRLRWGYSADATPNIVVHALMVEMAFAEGAFPFPRRDRRIVPLI